MEETVERVGLFGRLSDKVTTLFHRDDDFEEEDFEGATNRPSLHVRTAHRYHITVRRQIVSFQDAVAAADGLKRGEQQILNLTTAAPDLREKIKDFMCGVNYTAEGTWEELGEHVFLLAPASAFVETAPASQRSVAARN